MRVAGSHSQTAVDSHKSSADDHKNVVGAHTKAADSRRIVVAHSPTVGGQSVDTIVDKFVRTGWAK